MILAKLLPCNLCSCCCCSAFAVTVTLSVVMFVADSLVAGLSSSSVDRCCKIILGFGLALYLSFELTYPKFCLEHIVTME